MRKIFVGLMLGILLGATANADSIKVGVEKLIYAPYYSYEGTKVKGAIAEVLDKFAASSGHAVVMESLPVARLLPAMLGNEVGFKFPDNKFWGGDAKKGHNIIYSDPVFEFTDGTIVKSENKGKTIKRLGTVRGFTAWDYLGDIKAGKVKVVEGTSLDSLLKMLEAGRIDGLYFNVVVAEKVIAKANKSGAMVFDESLPHTTSHYHLSANANQKIIDDFNAFMKKESAWIQSLKTKHGIN